MRCGIFCIGMARRWSLRRGSWWPCCSWCLSSINPRIIGGNMVNRMKSWDARGQAIATAMMVTEHFAGWEWKNAAQRALIEQMWDRVYVDEHTGREFKVADYL